MRRLHAAITKYPWLAYLLSLIAAGWYAYRTWLFSQRLTTMILDESMYVYKGYLFAIGKYSAYQDYGPLTNHMPLSFIIPGFVQRVFGPGMQTARVFAFAVGLVMLAGFWLAFERLGGEWWGTFIVWVLALSTAWQEVFSQGLSQGLVNAFIAWGFAFMFGKAHSKRQMGLAGGLFALAAMTRINTLPVLILMVVYIFWQHGWRKGLTSLFGSALVIVVVGAFFWPDILKFIAGWIPEGWVGFVEPYRSPWSQQHLPDGFSYLPFDAWIGNFGGLQWDGIRAFSEAINFNLISFLAVFGTIFFWPRHNYWPSIQHKRLSLMLLLTWLVMAGLHIWVALSGRSCRFFCLAGYFTFFNFVGLLLLPAAFSSLRRYPPGWRNTLAMGALFGMVYATLYTGGYRQRWMFEKWYKFMHLEIPRFSNGKFIPDEKAPLLGYFEGIFKLDYQFLVEILPKYLYWIILLLLVFAIVPLIHRIKWRAVRGPVSAAWLSFVVFAVLAAALGPTVIFTYESPVMACKDSVVASVEQAGSQLAGLIAPGSLVYQDLTTNMLLLYLPEIEIFPPQLNTSFNFIGRSSPEDSNEIYRFGYWDEYLKEEWLEEADVLLIPSQFASRWQEELTSEAWLTIGELGPYESCRPSETIVYVLERVTPDE
ncbi:MAG: hypothetical protein JW757_07985 [Anaerolineales bacterium]|nr:hypothetical protein [Anaerolineales bacterium]